MGRSHLRTLALAAALAATLAAVLAASSGATTARSSGLTLAAIKAAVIQDQKPINGVTVNEPPIKGLKSLRGKKILVVPALGIVFNPAIQVIAQALKPLGVHVQECDGQANPSTMASCMQEAPTIAHLAGVMTLGVPPAQTANAYALLAKKKIPVLAAQQDADGTKVVLGRIGFVGSTALFEHAIPVADDYVIAKSNGQADVVALGDNSSPDVVAASNDMVRYLHTNCPDCKVLLKLIPSQTISEATPFVSSQVLADPNFNWLVALNQDVSGQAVAAGLQSANATTKVQQGGVGPGLGSMQGVANGSASYVAAIAGALNAWNWTDAMLRVIAKQRVPAHYPEVVRLFDSSNIHSVSLTPAGLTNFSWFGKANYEKQYLKIWGVK